MSKERLEEAKLMAEMLRVETRLPHDFPFDLVDWLVEQSERVQELEDELQELKKKLLTLTKENNQVNDELIDEFRKNKRYWEFINNIKTASEQPISYDELLGVIQSEYKALEESE